MKNISVLAFCLQIMVLSGCAVTTPVRNAGQLSDPLAYRKIAVYTSNGAMYEFTGYRLADSVLWGGGTCRTASGTVPFAGTIRLDSIMYVESYGSSFAKGLLFFGSAVLVAVLMEIPEDHFDVHQIFSGGSSCPFLYSRNGGGKILEGEAIAVALGRAAEMTTSTMMSSLQPDAAGMAAVSIANERYETHYINTVSLVQYDVPNCCGVMLDQHGQAWTVALPEAPVVAQDASGKRVEKALAASDNIFWESDMREVMPGSSFEDRLECTFIRKDRNKDVSIIVCALNTEFSNTVMLSLDRLLGRNWLPFIDAIEHDSSMIAAMDTWRKEASLRVSVWNGKIWQETGRLLPEANVVSFERLIRCPLPDGIGDTVKIRLSAMTDVWKIDRVGIDTRSALRLTGIPLEMAGAATEDGRSSLPLISKRDSLYEMLILGQELKMNFKTQPVRTGMHAAFALSVGGFLYEWQNLQPGGGATADGNISADGTIGLIKQLLKHKDIFLPPLYEEWKQAKKMHSNR